MRETALMDVLQGPRTSTATVDWAPSAEKVLNHEELVAPDTGPELGDPDLGALEDLTFAELARARGLDPDAIEPIGRLGRSGAAPPPETFGRDRFRTVPAAVRGVAPTPWPPRGAGGDGLPTWPPAGEAAVWLSARPTATRFKGNRLKVKGNRLKVKGNRLKVKGNRLKGRRSGPARSRKGRRMIASATVAAALAGAAAGWVVAHRPVGPSHWDPRVASIAAFVAQQTARPWKHPVAVSFLPVSAFAARFGTALPPPPGPIGAAAARFAPQQDTVFVNGPVLDVYRKVALAGQLGQALEAQYSLPARLAVGGAAAAQTAYVRALPQVQAQTYQREARAGG
jgi:hypothetical protein